MSDFDYQQLDDIIHSRIRLAVMSVLITVEEAEFTFLRDKVNATDGNLSVHLKKLEDAEYIAVKKNFVDRKPQTNYKLTAKGRRAFEEYIKQLEKMIKK
jgi:DNA-binding MarR family transcriptional regulator